MIGIISSGKWPIKSHESWHKTLHRILNSACSTITGLMIAYDIKEKLTQALDLILDHDSWYIYHDDGMYCYHRVWIILYDPYNMTCNVCLKPWLILSKGFRPSILKVFAFSCRIVFRLMFFTFGNLTILVFLLNDQRIDKWRGILLGDNVAIIGKISQNIEFENCSIKYKAHIIMWLIYYYRYMVLRYFEKLESCYLAWISLDYCW